jgi:NADH dehydrogenase FAD-containing subunit
VQAHRAARRRRGDAQLQGDLLHLLARGRARHFDKLNSYIDTRNVAQPLRRALIREGASFRRAELKGGEVPRSKLTFVVIGGEATEVETASDLHELIHDVIAPATRT